MIARTRPLMVYTYSDVIGSTFRCSVWGFLSSHREKMCEHTYPIFKLRTRYLHKAPLRHPGSMCVCVVYSDTAKDTHTHTVCACGNLCNADKNGARAHATQPPARAKRSSARVQMACLVQYRDSPATQNTCCCCCLRCGCSSWWCCVYRLFRVHGAQQHTTQ